MDPNQKGPAGNIQGVGFIKSVARVRLYTSPKVFVDMKGDEFKLEDI